MFMAYVVVAIILAFALAISFGALAPFIPTLPGTDTYVDQLR